MWQALSLATGWYNSLTAIELSPEFENLAGAVIGRHKSHQSPSILVEG
jgi:hypothetical protein